MKSIAVKLLLKALKLVGAKTAIRMGWKYYFYPLLSRKAKETRPEWDEKFVEAINNNLESLLKLF